VCFSATKGLVAVCFLMLADQGRIDLDAPIAAYWPELGRGDTAKVTARMILDHRAGLSAVDAPLTLLDVRDDPQKVHDALVQQVPLWEPGTDQGYAACSFGLYAAELFRRVAGESVGAFFATHVAGPLGVGGEAVLGRPDALNVRPARLLPVSRATLFGQQIPTALFRTNHDARLFRRVIAGRRTDAGRALLNPTLGPTRFEVLNDPAIQAIELPWMNALTTARALAKVYAPLAGDGSHDGVRLVRAEAIEPLGRRASWTERDRVLQKPIGWSAGFVKEGPGVFTDDPRAFGHPGAGGALGWADPARGLAIGYAMNQMDWRVRSPRAMALCHAAERVLASTHHRPGGLRPPLDPPGP
jgi:CubicO group peptidase (beta-lactamase class C family)